MAQAQLAKEQDDDEEEAVAEPVTVARLGALLQKMSQGAVPPEVRRGGGVFDCVGVAVVVVV